VAAERDYRDDLRVTHMIGHGEGVAAFRGNLAALALRRETWPKAENLVREGLPLFEKVARPAISVSLNHPAR
jgi:hypothetical protein